MNCDFCEHPEQFDRLKVKEFKQWVVHLSPNQSYLGWCDISLKRHLEDIFEVTREEAEELVVIVEKIKKAIRASFHNDIFNYTSLGNRGRHVHLHLVPRYSEPVEFSGQNFVDARWGQNYSPYDKSFNVSREITNKIIKTIAASLSS